MTHPPVVFNGTEAESAALIAALAKNCGCLYGPDKLKVTFLCAAHGMLHDQRALNGLLAYRHLADRLRKEEGLA
jgi:hypothetical protein